MKSIRFKYINWHGDEHEYVMTPEPSLTYGAYGWGDICHWLISGHVSHRDGVERPRRRTFQLTGMRDIESVNKWAN